MRYPFQRRFATLLAICTLTIMAAGSAHADPKDYRFEAVQAHVKAAGDTVVALRLIHIPDNKPVTDAVIFGSKMEMPMAGMAPMATKVAALKSTTPGEYRFQTDLSDGGSWTLTVSAKVQGETGTVSGSVPFIAMK
ncbi:FixH family protein [Telmatospirillum siberiense]|uniref:Heavy metal RND transporter n=1 Tax=Telmatospirillum siberiense TaxID=382514 RepID=A0A2N3PQI7_9PROT|nr:FixH family protein [Telmatospirillum siberiense]PKU22675.1 heavy metal RND transporter [Telmatospirillum siberiense]